MDKDKQARILLQTAGLLIAVTLLLCFGCAHRGGESSLNEYVAPSADQLWTPPVADRPAPAPAGKTVDIPPDLLAPGRQWQIMDVIEVALRNNPRTRAAWYEARSAAADLLSAKGAYWPQAEITAGAAVEENLAPDEVEGDSVNSFEPALELSWLLFDFGGRSASVEEKRQALLAADFSHNAAIQDAVLLVLQTYFQYVKSKALVKSAEASLQEAAQNLAAAEKQHEQGLATIADVLQAKTALSRAQLNLDDASGRVQVLRGALATAMGVPANTPYDIEDLQWNPPLDRMTDQVDDCIRRAQANRPDLAAQKSAVEQAVARTGRYRSELYPTVSLKNRLDGRVDSETDQWQSGNTSELLVNVPLFYGYSRRYDLIKAEQDARVRQEQFQTLEQRVIFQVWSSYFNLKTAARRVRTSEDLLNSARQSYDVALGRYQEGVGGFLDLLAAQSTLENARAQRVEAVADWYVSLANLARDTGALWSREPDEKGILEMLPSATMKENKP
jgi:outer membrane protein TolC